MLFVCFGRSGQCQPVMCVCCIWVGVIILWSRLNFIENHSRYTTDPAAEPGSACLQHLRRTTSQRRHPLPNQELTQWLHDSAHTKASLQGFHHFLTAQLQIIICTAQQCHDGLPC